MFKQYVTLPSGRLRPFLAAANRVATRSKSPASGAMFLSPTQAAGLLGISLVTLGRWRIEGSGPQFCKFGRVVRYDRDELSAWARSRTRRSTSEA